jgi:hypothetical protein
MGSVDLLCPPDYEVVSLTLDEETGVCLAVIAREDDYNTQQLLLMSIY